MQLIGTLYNAAGPLANVTITFEATATTMNGVLVSSDAQFTTQEDGTYLINLEAGHYHVYWNERGHRVRLGTVTADQFSEASLPEVLKADPVPVDSSAITDEIQAALDQMNADLATSTALRDETAGLRDEAQQAVTDAEAARDSAVLTGNVYEDAAAGLLGTSDTDHFVARDAAAPLDFLVLYRNDAGSATALETYPTAAAMDESVQIAYAQRAIVSTIEQRIRWNYDLNA